MSLGSSRPAIDLGELAPDLGLTCGDYCRSYRDELAAAVRQGHGGIVVARRHARILDGLLGALFCAADAASRAVSGPASAGRAPGRIALVAVGGYGRQLLGIHSDIDVLFLCDDPSDRRVGALAEGLLYPLWDLGLQIGHAVRGVDETIALARDDIRTATTLLDLRRVAGDKEIIKELGSKARRNLFEPDLAGFLEQLVADCRARHERFGGSLFLLEPEVKLGCGGLRDLDAALWAAQARWGARDLDGLVRAGAILRREAEELLTAEEMLWRVRNLLHLRARRRHDRLTFEDQEEIARELGFVDGVMLGVEQFMQAYYRHARVVDRMSVRILDRAGAQPRKSRTETSDLGGGVMRFGDTLTLKDSADLREDPVLALRFYKEVARRGLRPYSFARDAIAQVASDPEWSVRLRASSEASALFFEALTCGADPPLRRGSVLAELHELGLLLAMIPEFEPVTGRVQHDIYHVYTVDVHSVAAVDRLRAIKRGELAGELPLACRLAAELPRPAPLFLALLLHDIGKAHGKDHSRHGAQMARPIAERLGLAEADVAHVVWLVEEHLSLYHWATRRDTSDPAVVAEVAEVVGSLDRLRDLYLLTVADLSTTNPQAMTSWKARMLENLYLAVAAELEGERLSPKRRADAARAEAAALAAEAGEGERARLLAFLEGMPDRYLLANSAEGILDHARIAAARGEARVHLAVRPGPSEDVAELVLVMDDRLGLLSDVTAALSSHRLGVTAAQIYTRQRAFTRGPSTRAPGEGSGVVAEAFDVFHVRRAGRTEGPVIPPPLFGRLEADLAAIAAGRLTGQQALARRGPTPAWGRKGPEVLTEVQVDNEVSAHATVVDVFTKDRPGLLHVIARTLTEQGLTISLSKVNTEGDRVADVFYVQNRGGEKVREEALLRALPEVLRDAILKMDEAEARR